jgi:hypothetical protein
MFEQNMSGDRMIDALAARKMTGDLLAAATLPGTPRSPRRAWR